MPQDRHDKHNYNAFSDEYCNINLGLWKRYAIINEEKRNVYSGRVSRIQMRQEESMIRRRKKRGKLIAVLILLILVLGIGTGVFVYYQTQPFLSLNGDEKIQLNLCQVFKDPGVSAKIAGKNAGSKVRVSSDLNSQVPGTYTIRYTLNDITVERYVTVTNNMDPVLRLKGGDSMYIDLGETFEEPGYSASDHNGKSLTKNVKVDMPELTAAGKQEISYSVTDQEGKCTKVTRQIRIMPNTEYDTPGLPICMYHYVYEKENPPEDLYHRFGNYIEAGDLEEELMWLKAEGYYFPTWREVREYIDGELLLPDKSIVLCFDDGARSFLENGIPILEKCRVPATCFMITSESGAEKVRMYQSPYVRYQSHSHNMHRSGGSIGHGGIFTVLSEEEALEDLNTSVEICRSGDAFAYPYGDYTQQCRDILEESGFLCAVTTEAGKAKPGMDALLLPRVRMSMGQSLSSFQNMVSP